MSISVKPYSPLTPSSYLRHPSPWGEGSGVRGFLKLTALIILLSCSKRPAEFYEISPTYCNPVNLDYAFIPSRHTYYAQDETHRSTADPVIVNLRDTLYLFSTNQNGYWWSADMRSWNFIKHDFKLNSSGDNVCAPGAWAWGDSLLFIPSFNAPDSMPLYLSTNPKNNQWTTLTDFFSVATWDPSFFKDDDGKAYVYWGSSNKFPLYGQELDPSDNYKPVGEKKEIMLLHPNEHGWERFGENNSDTTIAPYLEGAWMTKHNGKYYFQFSAPGTEWNIYADGALVGDHPLGPFTYASYNPFSLKPGGFITGSGHGSTFKDKYGNYWHAATMLSWIKYKFERRLGIFPAGFDPDGQLYCITAFGDYPTYHATDSRDQKESLFTGWTLQSYKKKSWASSSLPGKDASLAFNENIRNYWSAATAKKGEFIAVDLGAKCDVYAIQINYADEDVHLRDKQDSIYHQYIIYHSVNGTDWDVLIDKSENRKDVPHDYIQLKTPFRTRYLKLENVHMAAGKFAISGFRVFGTREGVKPSKVNEFVSSRYADTRDVTFKWQPVKGAYAYNIYYGIGPEKLFNSIMVHDSASYYFRGLNLDQSYYARVEAIGETGVSKISDVIKF
jgi:xylan 1,4-beta-xylosidase